MKINLTAGSGWSHTGGPWIKPEQSMQRLELSQEIVLKGPGLKEVTIGGGDPLVAVLGYRINEDKNTMRKAGVTVVPSSSAPDFPVDKALDHDPATRWISKGAKAGDGPTDAHPEWLVFEFPNPYAAAAMYIRALPRLRPEAMPTAGLQRWPGLPDDLPLRAGRQYPADHSF